MSLFFKDIIVEGNDPQDLYYMTRKDNRGPSGLQRIQSLCADYVLPVRSDA